jgi:2-oxoglutarate ferredoxin oxidoreductase subunit beta
MVHDQAGPIGYAAMLAEMQPPAWPMPVGVIRSVEAPTFDAAMTQQIRDVTGSRGAGDMEKLLYSGNTWEVK